MRHKLAGALVALGVLLKAICWRLAGLRGIRQSLGDDLALLERLYQGLEQQAHAGMIRVLAARAAGAEP